MDFQYIENYHYKDRNPVYLGARKWAKPTGGGEWETVVSNYYIESVLADQSVRAKLNEVDKRKALGFCGRNFAAVGVSGNVTATTSWSDNFAGEALDPRWITIGSPTLVVSSNKLNITQSTTGGVKTVNAENFNNKSFSVQMIRLNTGPSISNALILSATDSFDNYFSIDEYNGQLRATHQNAQLRSIPYDPAQHKYIRIRFSNETTYYEFSEDGDGFTIFAIGVLSTDISAMYVYLRQYVGDGSTVSVDFKDAKIISYAQSGTATGKSRLIEIDASGNFHIIENQIRVKSWTTRTAATNNELRVQIVQDGSIYLCKYWYRENTGTAEKLMHSSSIPNTDFPLHARVDFYDALGTIDNLSIEESVDGASNLKNLGRFTVDGRFNDVAIRFKQIVISNNEGIFETFPKTKQGWLHPVGVE